MAQDFDNAAIGYDETFTNTKIGKRQRQVVWNYVDHLIAGRPRSILELNCGTGEDARHFAEAGHNVLATDISEEMLLVTQGKCQSLQNVSTQVLDLSNPPDLNQQFDLIFSNFGGLNCLDRDELKRLANWSMKHLSKDGRLVLVIMPRDTLIEKWYRTYKRDNKSIELRQSNQPTIVNVDGQAVRTYFYNPDEIVSLFKGFKLIKVKATGYVPSYWSGHRMEGLLLMMSKVFSAFGLGAKFGDHFLVEMRRG
jgi:ubiquinone/menaquinone biosynthesis C-methylase UbiE